MTRTLLAAIGASLVSLGVLGYEIYRAGWTIRRRAPRYWSQL